MRTAPLALHCRCSSSSQNYPLSHDADDARDFMPSLDASRPMPNIDTAAHEWIGLIGYWLTRETDGLFPAP
jgi:hypothetical protein